jgi:hypothetical protein
MTEAKKDRRALENKLVLAGTLLSWEVRVYEDRPMEYLVVIGELFVGAETVRVRTNISKQGWEVFPIDKIVDDVLREVGVKIGLVLVGKGEGP